MSSILTTRLLKTVWLLSCTVIVATGFGQVKKQFSVDGQEQCKEVELTLRANTGNCFIRPGQNAQLLNIYSNQDTEDYAHRLQNEMVNGVCKVNLVLEQEGKVGVGHRISYQMFGQDGDEADKFWKIYLTEEKPYTLDLSYGMGNADMDLSGLTIRKLKINTGSADVHVTYHAGVENKVDMDTFFVKVDLGTVDVRDINLARSKVIMADVGFGTILMDFSRPMLVPSHVRGSVGAGNMLIVLPEAETPVIVRVNESWLCSLHFPRSLRKISDDTWVNAAYESNSKQAIHFDLDVSLGKIVFKEASR
ncbi:MAG: hypothetical protein K1X47_03925 [Cyclobacteriaceae bacterium]|nr:hypothetical protein [Cyclobacteriaceae bacterium]